MYGQSRAILWAQWRTLFNHFPHSNAAGLIFGAVVSVVWYGTWVSVAFSVGALMADPKNQNLIAKVLPWGLLFAFLYWQVVPILMATTGASLDIRKLMVYPIPHGQLFGIEVLLRVSTGIETLILMAGASIGLMMNPALPWWAPVSFIPYILLNLFLAAGFRDLFGRLLVRKGVREISVLFFVVAMALPQALLLTGAQTKIIAFFDGKTSMIWPWIATAQIAQGRISWGISAVLASWLMAAYFFGRWQFERGLRFDSDEGRSTAAYTWIRKPVKSGEGFLEKLYRVPSAVFKDPLGALIEKELRFLSRAPRFRLVFIMGFTFGLLVWLPMALRRGSGSSMFAANYLTYVSVYALTLLGEVSFWNCFGFDRSASQVYFLMPVRFSTVLIGKNIAAATFVFLEITAVAVVCALLRMPITPAKVIEAYSVTLVMTLYLLGMGNMSSTRNPRPVNPSKSLRSSSGKRIQALLLVFYPLSAIPVMLAFAARYAFGTELAFYSTLGFAALLGATFYWVAMDSSVEIAQARTETIIATLSQGEGPISN